MDDARVLDDGAVPKAWPGGGGWEAMAGPADRVSFFAEQARHRRATWRMSAVCIVAVLLAGLPLCLVITPLMFGAIVVLTKLASLVVPMSPAVPQLYRDVAGVIGSILPYVEYLDGSGPPVPIVRPLLGVVSILVPGVLAMGVLWLALRSLFARWGVGAILTTLGARAPKLDDLEERQLVNVVEEMAIAAGLPAPRVMLLDGQVANAAAVGSSPEDAVVVVSRRLLDEMDRDATQGVLGHLVASIGNGDLGIALGMVTVFRTFGLVTTLLDAPVSPTARRTLWRLLRLTFGRRGAADGATADGATAEESAVLLTASASEVVWEDVDQVLGSDEQRARVPGGLVGLFTKVRVWALFPIWAGAGLAKVALMMLVWALLGPLIALTWRTRRYLADATAVRLTRNPDGLARGLMGLAERGGGIRGGEWAAHLFVIGGRTADAVTEAVVAAKDQPVMDRARAAMQAAHAQEQASRGGTRKESELGMGLGWVALHPPLEKRFARLRALGAHVDPAAFSRQTGRFGLTTSLILFSPLLLLVAVLMTIALGLSIGLIVVFMMIPMLVVYGLFEWLF